MKREEKRAITRLIDTFGADIALTLRNQEEVDTATRLRRRIDCEAIIEACTACPLHKLHGTPLVPYWSPVKLPREGRVAVLGDAPTVEEYRAKELGRGPMYRAIYTYLRDGGIDPSRVTYLTSVFCTPLIVEQHGGMTRTPPPREHVATCTANVLRALHAADVSYILLLGGTATRSWRPDLKLATVAGRWYTWRNKWVVYPIEHPSVVLTRTGAGKDQALWYEDIRRFARGVGDNIGLEGVAAECVICEGKFYAWDDDGVGWCKDHFKPEKIDREHRKKLKLTDTAQERLL